MSLPAAMVVAHPDDEVIGAGAQLPSWRELRFIHTTDGAPRDMRDAKAYGFSSREDYARARQRELEFALALAGFPSPQLRNLRYVDQEAAFDLVSLTKRLVALFEEWQPAVVVTHPYEGGHPDHDATAFAVHAAVRLLEAAHGPAPQVVELTSYHNRAGIMATGEFLPRAHWPSRSIHLTPLQRVFKRRLLDCFTTQKATLAQFSAEWERFRPAPPYDFTQPPHEGTLFYEMFAWGMTARLWCSLTTDTLRALNLEPVPAEPVFVPGAEDGLPAALFHADTLSGHEPLLDKRAA